MIQDVRSPWIFLCQLQVHVTNWLVPLRPTCVHRSTITGAGTAGDVETAGDVVDIPQQRIPYTVDAHRTRIFGSITSVHHHPRWHPAFITTWHQTQCSMCSKQWCGNGGLQRRRRSDCSVYEWNKSITHLRQKFVMQVAYLACHGIIHSTWFLRFMGYGSYR